MSMTALSIFSHNSCLRDLLYLFAPNCCCNIYMGLGARCLSYLNFDRKGSLDEMLNQDHL